MPYLKQEDREELTILADAIAQCISERPQDQHAGAINYAITRMLLGVLGVEETGLLRDPPRGLFNYDRLNSVVGALECCKLELYRRLIGPYEEWKADCNGDVL